MKIEKGDVVYNEFHGLMIVIEPNASALLCPEDKSSTCVQAQFEGFDLVCCALINTSVLTLISKGDFK